MSDDLVSIIMLSRNRGQFVEETVRSVINQTYNNWEVLFVDDCSDDNSVSKILAIKDVDDQQRSSEFQNWNRPEVTRIRVMKMSSRQGEAKNRNSALKEAKGRWVAFLDVGDVWAPDKLEKQIRFMGEYGYAFSYTKYGLMNEKSQNRGVVVGGKAHVNYKEMRKCCWPAYLTVMYDTSKVGRMFIRNQGRNNDYALWLNVCEKVDCHLLPENLATLRTRWNYLGNLFLTNKFKWHYDSYRIEEDLGPITSFLYAIRNGWYGLVKWMKYVKRG